MHNFNKDVSAVSLFANELGTATAIQLKQNGILKEHITKSPALLICVTGLVTYKDEKEKEMNLESGDYIAITPNVKHWLYATVESQLVLLK